jgi:hypothetical protein
MMRLLRLKSRSEILLRMSDDDDVCINVQQPWMIYDVVTTETLDNQMFE